MTGPTPTGAELVELEELAVTAATEAGDFIVAERPTDLGVSTKSTQTDVVTVMDRRSEDLLRGLISAARPDDAVYGEEAGGRAATGGITWVIDPIDGTVNYLYRIPHYAVSVAAVVGDPRRAGAWHPVAGAVYNPVSGEVFHARLGGGSAVRQAGTSAGADRALRVAPGPVLAQALVATGFAYAEQTRRVQAEVLQQVLPRVRDIRRHGSAALDLCAVAAGTVDGYYEEGLQPWDLAAGWLVVTEAGGTVSGWQQRLPADPGVVAGSPQVHRGLLDIVDHTLGRLRSGGDDGIG